MNRNFVISSNQNFNKIKCDWLSAAKFSLHEENVCMICLIGPCSRTVYATCLPTEMYLPFGHFVTWTIGLICEWKKSVQS